MNDLEATCEIIEPLNWTIPSSQSDYGGYAEVYLNAVILGTTQHTVNLVVVLFGN